MNKYFTSYQDYPIASIAEWITLLPLVIGLFFFRSGKRDILFLLILFGGFFCRDIWSNILASSHENNLFIYNIFSFLELILLACFFYNNHEICAKRYKKIVIWGAIVALIIDSFFYSTENFSVVNFTVARFYGVIMIMGFFERVLSELTIKRIYLYPLFWTNSGLLLYFCGTFFIFLLGNEVLSNTVKYDVFKQYWDISLLFYIVLCVLASVGIWLSKYDHETLF